MTKISAMCIEPIPSVAVDGIQSAGNCNGMMRLNLYEDKYDPIKGVFVRHIVMRLVMGTERIDTFIEEAKVARKLLQKNQKANLH